MGKIGHTVRVFVSSTFRDMHAERDYLNRIVFPELRSRCQKRGAEFIGLDLRWGVTEEEAQREGALKICLDEIERCRPFFVCLLGDRFGWVPPPEEVPGDFFEQLKKGGQLSAEVTNWYHLDRSSVPPLYRLRRDQPLANDMAEILAHFWENQGLPHAGESITAREISRGLLEPDFPRTYALFYLRSGGIEKQAGFPEVFARVFTEADPGKRRKLEDLKTLIRQRSDQTVVRDYEVHYSGIQIDANFLPTGLSDEERAWVQSGIIAPDLVAGLKGPLLESVEKHGTIALSGLEELGQRILDDLWAAIERELEQPGEQLDNHQRERAYHERFIIDRTRLFLGRQELVDRALTYLDDTSDNQPLIFTGDPGCGKSALLAAIAKAQRERSPEALIVPHFIGASPGSAILANSLRSICVTLRRECNLTEEVSSEPGPGGEAQPPKIRPMEVPDDPLKLRQKWPTFLEKAGVARTIVLLLDAVNQFDQLDKSHELFWFPFQLPQGVKLIASTLAGDCLDRFRRRLPADHIIVIQPLFDHERRALVEKYLDARRKKLSEEQLTLLLDNEKRPQAGLPLYLLVALEELCLFGSFEALTDRIDHLPPTVADLFDQVLARLEHDHGRDMTVSICRWLAVSRSGMLEAEILDLLGGDKFPRVKWTRFYRAIEPYLRPVEETTGAGLLDFYHDQLRLAAFRRYLGMQSAEAQPTEAFREAHRELAQYFRSIAIEEDGEFPKWRTILPRPLCELPYHQTGGCQWQELQRTLCDLRFIQARCVAGAGHGLMDDYLMALQRSPDEKRAPIEGMQRFLRARLHLLAAHPMLTLQEAANQPHGTVPAEAAAQLLEHGLVERPWLRIINQRPSTAFCAMTLVGHAAKVMSCEYRSDGSRIVSMSVDGNAKIWDASTGICLQTMEVELPSDSCVLSPNRSTIFMIADCDLWIWDVGHLVCSVVLKGHRESITKAVWSPDSLRITSVSQDHTLKIWDVKMGVCIATREIGYSPRDCAWSPDGVTVAVTRGRYVTLWDVRSSDCPMSGIYHNDLDCLLAALERRLHANSSFEGHEDNTSICVWSPDGRRLASASENGELRVWTVATGECIFVIKNPTPISACAWSPDGSCIVAGSGPRSRVDTAWEDNVLRVWNIPATIEGGAERSFDGIIQCAWVASKRAFMSLSSHGVLMTCDPEIGLCVKTLDIGNNCDKVTAWALSPDGRWMAIGVGVERIETPLQVWDVDGGYCKFVGGSSYECSWSPDGARILSNAINGGMTVLTVDGISIYESNNCLRPIWSPDGQYVAFTSSYYQSVKIPVVYIPELLDLSTGHAMSIEMATASRDIYSWSPDGRLLALHEEDGVLNVCDCHSGHRLAQVEGNHTGSALDENLICKWSPDGRKILLRSSEGIVAIYDFSKQRCLFEHRTRALLLNDFNLNVWSPDGSRVVVFGAELNTIEVLNALTGDCELFAEVPGFVNSVAFGMCGKALAVGHAGGDLEVFRLMGISVEPALVIATYMYRHDSRVYDAQPTADCPACACRLPVSNHVRDTILALTRDARLGPDDSPCLKLPAEAWDETRLLSECPHCREPLKFNPFIVDNRDRYPTLDKRK